MSDYELALAITTLSLTVGSLILSGLPDGAWKAIIVALCIMSAVWSSALVYIFLSVFGYL